MTEAGIWLIALVAGVALLGVLEAVRSGRFSGPRWQTARFAVLAAMLAIVAVISGFLAVTWVIVMVLWEVWEAMLVALGVLGGLALLVTFFVRRRSV